MTLYAIILKIALMIGVFFVNSLLAILILYISSLHARMKVCNTENIKLLDGMHEGLLILSKSTAKSVLFCN